MGWGSMEFGQTTGGVAPEAVSIINDTTTLVAGAEPQREHRRFQHLGAGGGGTGTLKMLALRLPRRTTHANLGVIALYHALKTGD